MFNPFNLFKKRSIEEQVREVRNTPDHISWIDVREGMKLSPEQQYLLGFPLLYMDKDGKIREDNRFSLFVELHGAEIKEHFKNDIKHNSSD